MNQVRGPRRQVGFPYWGPGLRQDTLPHGLEDKKLRLIIVEFLFDDLAVQLVPVLLKQLRVQERRRVVNVSLTGLLQVKFRHRRGISISDSTYPFFEIADLYRNEVGL